MPSFYNVTIRVTLLNINSIHLTGTLQLFWTTWHFASGGNWACSFYEHTITFIIRALAWFFKLCQKKCEDGWQLVQRFLYLAKLPPGNNGYIPLLAHGVDPQILLPIPFLLSCGYNNAQNLTIFFIKIPTIRMLKAIPVVDKELLEIASYAKPFVFILGLTIIM